MTIIKIAARHTLIVHFTTRTAQNELLEKKFCPGDRRSENFFKLISGSVESVMLLPQVIVHRNIFHPRNVVGDIRNYTPSTFRFETLVSLPKPINV